MYHTAELYGNVDRGENIWTLPSVLSIQRIEILYNQDTGIKIRQALRVNNLSSKFGKSPQNVKTKSSNGPWKCWLISISCCVKEKTKWPWKNLRALNFFNTRGPNGPWNCGHIWTPVITSMNCNSFLYLPNFPCHDVKCALSFTYLLRRMITSPVRPHMMAVALVAQW